MNAYIIEVEESPTTALPREGIESFSAEASLLGCVRGSDSAVLGMGRASVWIRKQNAE